MLPRLQKCLQETRLRGSDESNPDVILLPDYGTDPVSETLLVQGLYPLCFEAHRPVLIVSADARDWVRWTCNLILHELGLVCVQSWWFEPATQTSNQVHETVTMWWRSAVRPRLVVCAGFATGFCIPKVAHDFDASLIRALCTPVREVGFRHLQQAGTRYTVGSRLMLEMLLLFVDATSGMTGTVCRKLNTDCLAIETDFATSPAVHMLYTLQWRSDHDSQLVRFCREKLQNRFSWTHVPQKDNAWLTESNSVIVTLENSRGADIYSVAALDFAGSGSVYDKVAACCDQLREDMWSKMPAYRYAPADVTNCIIHVLQSAADWIYVRPGTTLRVTVENGLGVLIYFENCTYGVVPPRTWQKNPSWSFEYIVKRLVKLANNAPIRSVWLFGVETVLPD